MDIKNVLKDSEAKLAKGISTSSLNGGTGSATMTTRQDLDPTLTNLANRATPFRDKVKRGKGQGQAFTFNTVESLFSGADNTSPRESFYADGALPQYKTTEYGTKIVAYKPIGYAGSVTGLAQATAESLLDLYATEVEKTTRRVIQAEEWLAYFSRTDVANTQGQFGFPGLDELITTNIIDANGAAISKTLIDTAAKRISSYGGQATDVFCSNGVAIDINNLYSASQYLVVNTNDRDNLQYGNIISSVRTINGVWNITPDFFLNPANTYPSSNGTSSYPGGASTSTMFILAMPFIEMRDLKALGMEELGRTADLRSFYVNVYTALKLTAEKWCAKIINVKENVV